MKKKLTSVLFCLTLTLGLMLAVAGPAMAADTGLGTADDYRNISSWQDLQNTINESSENNPAYLKLECDVTTTGASPLNIINDKKVYLDLNGNTLSRTNATFNANGGVINVSGGSLTLLDGSDGQGIIKGGNRQGLNTGSGVHVSGKGYFDMKGGTIKENNSNAGVGCEGESTFIMDGGTISSNSAGTGVCCMGKSSFTMNGGEISLNSVGVKIDNSNMCMVGGTISKNSTYNRGGGVNCNNGTFTVFGGTISNNSGGGVYCKNSQFTMSGGTVESNSSKTQSIFSTADGGGVYCDVNTSFVMEGGKISNNTTSGNGGGVSVGSTFTMINGEIKNNTASGKGGGVCVKEKYASSGTDILPKFTMKGGTISGNTASQGGGVYDGCDFTMEGNSLSITGNKKNDNTENNVTLASDTTITIDSNGFNPTKPIGVTLVSGTGNITSGATYQTDAAARKAFVSEQEGYIVYRTDEDQAAIKQVTADEVQSKIDNLSTEDKNAVKDARAEYDALPEAQKSNVNTNKLTEAENALIDDERTAAKNELNQYKNDKNESNYDSAEWDNMGNAVKEGEDAIDAAKTLNDVDKAKDEAKAAMDAIKTKVQKVTEAINDLPASSEVTTANKKAIEDARAAYDALGDLKNQVSDDTLKKLTDAESALSLAEAKETAKAALDTLQNSKGSDSEGGHNDYDDKEWQDLKDAVTAGKNAIVNAASESDVTTAKENAEKAINEIKTKAAKVSDTIGALPDKDDVQLSNKDAIQVARAAYNALPDTQKGQVTNYSRLTDAEEKLESFLEDAKTAAITELENSPNSKTESDYDDEDWGKLNQELENGRQAINSADNINGVDEAKDAAIAKVKAIKTKAQKVTDAINALPASSEVTTANKKAIEDARAAYEALGDLKSQVTNDTLQKLTDAELALAKANAKADLDTLQESKGSDGEGGHNDYDDKEWQDLKDAVTAGKNAIDNASSESDVNTAKTNAETAITAIKTKAAKVSDMIGALPAEENVQLSDKDAIQAARAAYNALTDTQKESVGDISKLTKAEDKLESFLGDAKTAAITELENSPNSKTESDYDDEDWRKLNQELENGRQAINSADNINSVDEAKDAAIAKVKAIKTKVQKVTDAINALPESSEVTTANQKAIEDARAAYDALSDTQKQSVDNDTLEKLTDAELALAKANAKAALDTLQTEKGHDNHIDYDDTNWQALEDAVTAGKTNIDSAASKSAVTTAKENAETAINAIKTKAAKVSDMIGALPNKDDVQLSHKDAIQAARAAYNALTDTQKESVGDISKLTDAEEKLESFLGDAKTAAITELDQLQTNKGQTNYDEKEWGELTSAITEGQRKIDDATTDTIAKVDAAKQEAIDKVNAIKTKTEKLNDFKNKVDALPAPDQITTSDSAAIQEARAAYNALDYANLSDEQKAQVDSLENTLKAAEEALRKASQPTGGGGSGSTESTLDAAKTAAKADLDKLQASKNEADYDPADWQALTKAVEDGKAAIDAATTADGVNNAKAAATDAVNAIKTKAGKVDDVNDKISDLPAKDNVKAEDGAAIEEARAAYDALTDEEKAQVAPEDLKKLTDAEEKLAEIYPEALAKAKEDAKKALDDLKAGKKESDYTPEDWQALNKAIDDGKAAIDAADKINDVTTTKNDTIDAVNAIKTSSEAVDDVKDKINALPSKNNVKATDKDAIEAARAAYDALTDEQKAQVSPQELKKLTDAEEKLAEIYPEALAKAKEDAKKALDDVKTGKKESDFEADDWQGMNKAIEDGKAAIDKAETIEAVEEAKKAAEDAANAFKTKADKVAEVIDKINALPEKENVKAADKAAIKAARAAYEALSDELKAQVPADTLKKLTDAEEALKAIAPEQPTVYLRSHVQNIGWQTTTTKIEPGASDTIGTTGRSLRLEALDMVVPEDCTVTGFAHIQNYGDIDVVKLDNPDYAVPEGYTVYRFGTTGRALRMEAVEIHLLDEDGKPVEGFQYATHLQNIGWEGFVKNGSFSGTRGECRRLEAVRFAYAEADAADAQQ